MFLRYIRLLTCQYWRVSYIFTLMSTPVTRKNNTKQNISLVRQEDIKMLTLQSTNKYTISKQCFHHEQELLNTLASGWFWRFSQKNSSFRLPYQCPSSSADCARELFNGSNGLASLVDCTRKKFFCLGGAGFL